MNNLLLLLLIVLNFARMCYDNKDAAKTASLDSEKTVAEYLISYGYNFEEHKVKTPDGYILTLWRIPKKLTEKRRKYAQPVLLQHGVIDNAFSWLFKSINHNLATILVDQGYDVWLGNNRGSLHSIEHASPSSHNWRSPSNKFWDFSFDHMGSSDFPAMVDYITDVTGFDQLVYVGHSQGAAQFFIKAILDPQYVNSHIKSFVGLAPVLFVHHIPGAVEQYLGQSGLVDFLYAAGFKNFGVLPFMPSLYVPFCKVFPGLVRQIVTSITGHTQNQTFDLTRLSVMARNEVGGTSVQNMMHWVQLMRSGRFTMFDYGLEKNMEKYGQPQPPEYDLTKLKEVTVPTYLFAGKSDNIISPIDFEALVELLPNGTKYEYVPDYGHLDYIWADDAHVKIYPQLLGFIKCGSGGDSNGLLSNMTKLA